MTNAAPQLHWIDAGQTHSALWRSQSDMAPPKRVQLANDTLKADAAYRLACEGSALLWQGDFQNARQLLQAIARRIDRTPKKIGATPAESFHLHRQAQAQRARILAMLLVPLNADYDVPLRRAPNVTAACIAAYGHSTNASSVVSLRELQGLIGAHEWHKKGVEIPALGARIHPQHGVFSPLRGEYVDLVASTPLPGLDLAFDIGTGTGVLSAVLAKRGVKRIVATDQDPRALACAGENLQSLGYAAQVTLLQADLFPPGCAPLVVCNPPWVPARPSSPIEFAVYDPDSRMLLGFLNGLTSHLTPNGEGWLILSDLAEHLGLRSREFLLEAIRKAGLQILARHDIRPRHPRATDSTDMLHKARAAEVTSLWRLTHAADN